jgi:hypothetical protein
MTKKSAAEKLFAETPRTWPLNVKTRSDSPSAARAPDRRPRSRADDHALTDEAGRTSDDGRGVVICV